MCIKKNVALGIYAACLVLRMNFQSFAMKFAYFPGVFFCLFKSNLMCQIFDGENFAKLTFNTHGRGDVSPVNTNISVSHCQC